LYGGNPDKRKSLTQMRDAWWDKMAQRDKLITNPSNAKPPLEILENPKGVNGLLGLRTHLFHRVFPREGFETSAQILFELAHHAQQHHPGRKRILWLFIDGHRRRGKFDNEMFRLLLFIARVFIQYVVEARTPMFRLKNKRWQNNDVPEGLVFFDKLDQQTIQTAVAEGLEGIWLEDDGSFIRIEPNPRQKRKARLPKKPKRKTLSS
jgi:hypothetical protein